MTPDEVTALLRKADWKIISKQLALYAQRRLGGKMDRANEIAQEAITQVFDPAYVRWDPEKQSLEEHLGSVVNGLVINDKRKRRKRRTIDDELQDLQKSVDTPEEDFIDNDVRERALARLTESVAGDELASAVVDAVVTDGIEEPAKQAEALNQPIQRIYNARRRIVAHCDRIAREMNES